jgi:hypothetical protein
MSLWLVAGVVVVIPVQQELIRADEEGAGAAGGIEHGELFDLLGRLPLNELGRRSACTM